MPGPVTRETLEQGVERRSARVLRGGEHARRRSEHALLERSR